MQLPFPSSCILCLSIVPMVLWNFLTKGEDESKSRMRGVIGGAFYNSAAQIALPAGLIGYSYLIAWTGSAVAARID